MCILYRLRRHVHPCLSLAFQSGIAYTQAATASPRRRTGETVSFHLLPKRSPAKRGALVDDGEHKGGWYEQVNQVL
jgi:hypothetical protein